VKQSPKPSHACLVSVSLLQLLAAHVSRRRDRHRRLSCRKPSHRSRVRCLAGRAAAVPVPSTPQAPDLHEMSELQVAPAGSVWNKPPVWCHRWCRWWSQSHPFRSPLRPPQSSSLVISASAASGRQGECSHDCQNVTHVLDLVDFLLLPTNAIRGARLPRSPERSISLKVANRLSRCLIG